MIDLCLSLFLFGGTQDLSAGARSHGWIDTTPASRVSSFLYASLTESDCVISRVLLVCTLFPPPWEGPGQSRSPDAPPPPNCSVDACFTDRWTLLTIETDDGVMAWLANGLMVVGHETIT